MDEMSIDKILDLLSNKHRREILRLLSIEDRYAYELAKLLNITPRAVTNHLNALADQGLISSEKRSSGIGPDREYYSLDKDINLRITFGRHLFAAHANQLSSSQQSGASALQLSPPEKLDSLEDVIQTGLDELPKLKQQVEILERESTRYIRKYQGMMLHIGELLKSNGLNADETDFLLKLIEKGGRATLNELCEAMNKSEVTINPTIQNLKNLGLISTIFIVDDDGNEKIGYELTQFQKERVIYQ